MIGNGARSALLILFFGSVAVAEPRYIYRQDPKFKPPPSTPVLEGVAYTGTARPHISSDFALKKYLESIAFREDGAAEVPTISSTFDGNREPASEGAAEGVSVISPDLVASNASVIEVATIAEPPSAPPAAEAAEPSPHPVEPATLPPVEMTSVGKTKPIVEMAPAVEIAQPERPSLRVDVKPTVASKTSMTKPSEQNFWLWIGTGTNYQYYQQTVPELGKAKFQNISGPTWFLRGGFRADRFGLDLSYKDTPGKMNSSETVVIVGGEYSWKTISAEALYRPKENSLWGARLGLQHHLMPFMDRNPFDAQIAIRSNMLSMLTLGFDREIPVSDRMRVEWQMRFQHPIISGSTDGATFDVTPKIAIDGSIGGVISRRKNSRLGLFWYGQWHQYRFDYSGRTSFSGEQTLFYSNIELRYGLDF